MVMSGRRCRWRRMRRKEEGGTGSNTYITKAVVYGHFDARHGGRWKVVRVRYE